MKRAFFAGVCALALAACEASEQPATQQQASAPVASAAAVAYNAPVQQVAKVGGIPANMLVTNSRVVAQGATLDEADLQQLLVGNTIKQVDDQYWAYFAQGGVLKGLIVNLTENGSYTLSGGQVCKSWPTWATGMSLCYRVLNLGNAKYRFSGIGVDSFDVVISRGNPQKL